MVRILLLLACIFALALAQEQVQVSQDETDLIILTSFNFRDVINSNDFVLVKFFAPYDTISWNLLNMVL